MESIQRAVIPVRPEVERAALYEPGESLDAFSARVGIPVERLIKLNSNENPYGPSPRVRVALGAYAHYHRYPDPAAPALRPALEAYTGVPAAHLALGNGSNELIPLLWRMFLGPGDGVLLCPPTFSLYALATDLCGGTLVSVPRRPDDSVDPAAMRAALRPDTRIIVLCSPNNPTGTPCLPPILRRCWIQAASCSSMRRISSLPVIVSASVWPGWCPIMTISSCCARLANGRAWRACA